MCPQTITPPAEYKIAAADELFDAVFHRSSDFRIELDWNDALGFLTRVDRYNEFEAETVIQSLKRVDALIPRAWYNDGNPNNGQRTFRISVGREGSPVVYLDRYEVSHFADSPLKEETMRLICQEMELIARADEATYEIRNWSGGGGHVRFRFWWD